MTWFNVTAHAARLKRMGWAIALLLVVPAAALAQPAAPITVTPPDLRPQQRDNGFRIEMPEAGALAVPAGL